MRATPTMQSGQATPTPFDEPRFLRDLVDCDDISEPAILEELRSRFQSNAIYSSIGPILIVVNPFKIIPGLYSQEVKNRFVRASSILDDEPAESNPHVWKVACESYAQLLQNSCPQAVVISGESGAGKTEATKQCLQLLSAIASQWSDHQDGAPIEDRVLATNPILESFGNSKTARNNNSSRFGKWIQLNYHALRGSERNLQLTGARITQYLLEKSRVVVHSSEERNYHIFYQLCANAVLDLQPAANYRYLRFGKSLTVPGIDDRTCFQETLQSMDNLGFSAVDKNTIFVTLKGILLLGNLMFREDISLGDASEKAAVIGGDFQPLLHSICQIMCWRTDDLAAGLTSRTMTLRGETTRIMFNVQQAQNAVNALTKEIYGRLFNFIVYQANQSLNANSQLYFDPEDAGKMSVGVLDIFGFEKFKFNSFEQLCINYANEKLHQYFIVYVLKKEQELYEMEGIESSCVVPIDNSDVLLLFEDKKKGILARLDDELKIPKGTDESFLKKVDGDHNQRGVAQRRFVREVKMLPTHFEIRHFAGQILYDCAGFMEKNRDKLFEHLEALLASSTNPRFRELMVTDWSRGDATLESWGSTKSNSSLASATIATRFQNQLQSLMDMLGRSQPHFVKCIKPNNAKEPEQFEEELVTQQLRYSGVLEAIQIRKSGYPTRRSHDAFWKAFWMVPPLTDRKSLLEMSDRDKCGLIIDRLQRQFPALEGIKLGRTLVFLKPNVIKFLQTEKESRKLRASILGQSHFRRRKAYKLFRKKLQVRDKLRIAQANGNRFKASNVLAIPELQGAISMAKLHEIPAPWVAVGERLLLRLMQIKDCLDKLSQFESDSQQSNRDVIDEYSELSKLVELALSLAIESPQIEKVQVRLSVLKERADCVFMLRSSIQGGDEDGMNLALETAKALSSLHGSFCENDERIARQKLALIEEDHALAQKLCEVTVSLQEKFTKKLETDPGADHGAVFFKDFESATAQALQSWEKRPPVSPHCASFLSTIQNLKGLHSNWRLQNWPEAVQSINALRANRDSLQSAVDSSGKSRSYCARLQTCVDVELRLIHQDILVNVLLPKAMDAVERDRAQGVPGELDLQSEDVDRLGRVVDEIRSFSWMDSSVKPLLRCMELFLEVKSNFLEKRYERVVSMLENAEQRRQRVDLLHSWMEELRKGALKSSESELEKLEGLVSEIEGVESVGQFFASLEAGSFDGVRAAVTAQLDFILLEAADRAAQDRLAELVSSATPDRDEMLSPTASLSNVVGFLEGALAKSRKAAEIYSPTLLPSSTAKKRMASIESALGLWRLFEQQAWKAIVDSWTFGKDVEILSESGAGNAEQDADGCLSELRRSCVSVVLVALTQLAVGELQTEISAAVFTFAQLSSLIGDANSARTTTSSALTIAIESAKMNVAKFTSSYPAEAELLHDVRELVDFAGIVRAAREAHLSADFAESGIEQREKTLEEVRTAFYRMSSSPNVYDIAQAMVQEMQDMELGIRLLRSLLLIRNSLKPENADLHYLVPAPPGAVAANSRVRSKRPTAVGATALANPNMMSPSPRPKSLAFETAPANAGATSIEEIIIDDGMIFNQAMLVVNNLNETLEQVHELLSELENDDDQQVPSILQENVAALELIRDIRSSIYEEDWQRAYQLLADLQAQGLDNKICEIRDEISTNLETVKNYAAICCCYNALSKGQPTGPIGQVDYKSLSLTQLDEAVKFCETVGCVSDRAQNMFEAVLIVSDLRKAQKVGDWSEIRAVLSRADSKHVGLRFTAVCCGEISKACIERDNHELAQMLKTAIINEEMFTKEGTLDIEQVSVKELSGVLNRVQAMPEDTRGNVVKNLAVLADTVLKTRKCAMQGQWQHVESLLPVLKENVDSFQNELEVKDRQLARKTMSFRTTSFRTGSMAVNPKDSKKSILPLDGGAPASARSAAWEEFAELTQSVKREIKAIEHHFSIIELEKSLNDVLTKHGAQTAKDGAIDKASIQTEELQKVLEQASNLDLSNLSLPKPLKMLRKVGMLIHDLRQAMRKEEWSAMSALLEETLSGEMASWPEYSRLEIQAVRREVENRWIVTNLTTAIHMGKLEGEVGRAVLSAVSNSHFPSYIETAKSLNPRTEVSLSLLRTAEALCDMRGLLIAPTPDWQAVRKRAKEMIDAMQQTQQFHPIILPELKLIMDTADDQIVCNMVWAALSTGGPGGEPGALVTTSVVFKDLEKAYNVAVRSAIKTPHAKSLLGVCRIVQKLREAVVRVQAAREPARSSAAEAWRTIKALLAEIAEMQAAAEGGGEGAQSTSAEARRVWEVCSAEIDLIRKHTVVEELKHSIIESSIRASHIYHERHNFVVSSELTGDSVHGDVLTALAEEMENILVAADCHGFSCRFLSLYQACAASLAQLRKCLASHRLDDLLDLLQDEHRREAVSVLPEAQQEFVWIVCEYHNGSAIDLLRTALEAGNEEVGTDEELEKSICGSGQSFSERNKYLAEVLRQVTSLTLSSKLALQWQECCEKMHALRWNLEQKNHVAVNQALRWFKNSARICPLHVKMEAQRAFVIYQNDVLIQELSVALTVGKAVGKVGEVDPAAIEVAALESQIQQSRSVKPLFQKTKELVDAAEIVLGIRKAIKFKDAQALQEIVDDLSAQESHNLLIIDEIATARAELDNEIAVSALIGALKSFEDSESRAFGISFLQDGNGSSSLSAVDKSAEVPGQPRKSASHSILESLSERRYSFANKHSANIDPETIDIDVLDKGLRVSRDHGVHSTAAIRLYRTVELVRSLRLAMKQADWACLEEILTAANYEQEVGVKYDILASKEILAVRSQLEIREAIVDLSKALRVGWAKCSQGIVDTSTMDNERLSNAIDCADRCIMELSIQILCAENKLGGYADSQTDGDARASTEGKVGMGGGDQRQSILLENSPVHRRVHLLMESAKTVLRVREVLAMGNMELAGSLAEEALSGNLHHSVVEELRLYSKEINIALSAMNITETLRGHMNAGKLVPLFSAIGEAYKLESHLSNDLGLIRVLDNAERKYKRLLSTQAKLKHTMEVVYDPEEMISMLKHAENTNFSDSELETCKDRLKKLQRFSEIVDDYNCVWTCVRNERQLMRRVVDEAQLLRVTKHPQCVLTKLCLRTSAATLRAIKLWAAIRHPALNTFAICSETMRLKRIYLDLPSSQTKYRLEQFSRLRRPEDFAQRMTIVSGELLNTMLVHTDQPLPTSLTQLPPTFAAIAVHVFSCCVRGLENNIFTFTAVAVKQLVDLGCACIHLRDEILLQLVKQIRGNPRHECAVRIWKLLCACLYHFPPSRSFESYLELFLVQTTSSQPLFFAHADRAQRFLHRSIFLFGQHQRIKQPKKTLDYYDQWMAQDDYLPPDVLPFPCDSASEASMSGSSGGGGGDDAKRKNLTYYETVFGPLEWTETSSPLPAQQQQQSEATAGSTPPRPSLQGGVKLLPFHLRGSRDDWLQRFKRFHAKDSSKERGDGGAMSKLNFCAQLAQAITGKSDMDVADKQALFYLLFNKRVGDLRSFRREYAGDSTIFHFLSDDEAASSTQRRQWLWTHVQALQAANSSDSPPDLFFAQLQLSDAVAFVERFWDGVVEKMSRECRQFPFLRLDRRDSVKESADAAEPPAPLLKMASTRKAAVGSPDKSGRNDLSINWEIYRELVLTGMRLVLLRATEKQRRE